MYVALGCVFDCATIACAFRWGVAFVGDYHYWALLIPSRDYMSGAGQLPVDDAPYRSGLRRKPNCGFDIYIYCKYIWVVFICIRVM